MTSDVTTDLILLIYLALIGSLIGISIGPGKWECPPDNYILTTFKRRFSAPKSEGLRV
jgi:hypothetical protein